MSTPKPPRKTGSTNHPDFINPSFFKSIRHNHKWACTLCPGARKAPHMSYQVARQHERNSAEHASRVKQRLEQHPPQEHAQSSAWDQPSMINPWETTGPSADAWLVPATDHHHEFTTMTKEQLRSKEHQYFADQVDDMIPFWIRGIEAAERGEVLRLEEFLDSLENEADLETWPPRGPNPWTHRDRHSNYGGRAWEQTDWDVHNDNNDITKWIAEDSVSSAESGGRVIGRSHSSNHRVIHSKSKSQLFESVQDGAKSLVEVVARQNSADENRKREMYSFIELSTNEKVKKIDDLIRALRSS
ncbi:MAG: hypothetical protein NXY57DRAFT_1041731 [Lentinula lateritia]|uniref:Uncharacterized protein n=1 Tax=Lentinula lateritia TaxID=40482 RepID=A0ABQ8VSW8_9AGAR|nr:MAG: hypothetical protein NXY57DRAFT_1041731 [Lentinula lateritia]KAJ4499475.1 hypothetical protein C8R41DRAFT_863852 [Lentinula lateritia]